MTSPSRYSLWIIAFTLGCSGAESVEPEPAQLAACMSSWTTLFERSGASNFASRHLRWHEDALYYPEAYADIDGVVPPPRFMALPDTGEAPKLVVEGEGTELWLEGEQLLFAQADRLYATPRMGGDPVSQIADGETFGSSERAGRNLNLSNYGLDDSYMYWIVWEVVGRERVGNVWRLARAGGRSEQLGTLPALSLAEALVVLPDDVLVAGFSGESLKLSKGDGRIRALPEVESATFLGAAESGVMWSVIEVDRGEPRRATRLARATGERPEAFWTDKPAEIELIDAWSDRRDEWLFSAIEPFSDGRDHLSVWSVDTRGRAERLACDPVVAQTGVFTAAGALSLDAVYLAVQRRSGWEFVRTPR